MLRCWLWWPPIILNVHIVCVCVCMCVCVCVCVCVSRGFWWQDSEKCVWLVCDCCLSFFCILLNSNYRSIVQRITEDSTNRTMTILQMKSYIYIYIYIFVCVCVCVCVCELCWMSIDSNFTSCFFVCPFICLSFLSVLFYYSIFSISLNDETFIKISLPLTFQEIWKQTLRSYSSVFLFYIINILEWETSLLKSYVQYLMENFILYFHFIQLNTNEAM